MSSHYCKPIRTINRYQAIVISSSSIIITQRRHSRRRGYYVQSRLSLFVRALTGAIKTKLGTHALYSSRSTCIDPEVKKSKVNVKRYENCHGARLLVIIAAVP